MIAFSLNKELDPQEIISGIAGLIKKEVTCENDAASSILIIHISKISKTVDLNENSEIKRIEC